jgi:hypothetical protein
MKKELCVKLVIYKDYKHFQLLYYFARIVVIKFRINI